MKQFALLLGVERFETAGAGDGGVQSAGGSPGSHCPEAGRRDRAFHVEHSSGPRPLVLLPRPRRPVSLNDSRRARPMFHVEQERRQLSRDRLRVFHVEQPRGLDARP